MIFLTNDDMFVTEIESYISLRNGSSTKQS